MAYLRAYGVWPNSIGLRKSLFYFSESQQLYYTAEHFDQRKSDAEIDLLCVVDGMTYLCEAKSSHKAIYIKKFVDVAKRIRPDVAMLAVMEKDGPALKATFQRMAALAIWVSNQSYSVSVLTT